MVCMTLPLTLYGCGLLRGSRFILRTAAWFARTVADYPSLRGLRFARLRILPVDTFCAVLQHICCPPRTPTRCHTHICVTFYFPRFACRMRLLVVPGLRLRYGYIPHTAFLHTHAAFVSHTVCVARCVLRTHASHHHPHLLPFWFCGSGSFACVCRVCTRLRAVRFTLTPFIAVWFCRCRVWFAQRFAHATTTHRFAFGHTRTHAYHISRSFWLHTGCSLTHSPRARPFAFIYPAPTRTSFLRFATLHHYTPV